MRRGPGKWPMQSGPGEGIHRGREDRYRHAQVREDNNNTRRERQKCKHEEMRDRWKGGTRGDGRPGERKWGRDRESAKSSLEWEKRQRKTRKNLKIKKMGDFEIKIEKRR